ncbi:MAG: hypothetical protein KF861_17655, partial [Planctomycetaceae bacterium]|nr:hypothetical protein [Planctomycetaceae bacterium]
PAPAPVDGSTTSDETAAPAKPSEAVTDATAPAAQASQPVAASRSTGTAAESAAPLLPGWTPPAAAILLTGEQQGHLEPCGCSERQSGGLSRRAELADQLRARGWPVTGFDLGGVVKRTRRQSELKFEFTRDALNSIGYRGLGLGPEDLRLGPDRLFEWVTRTNAEANFDVPFVSANVTLFGTRDIGTPLTYRIVTVGDVKIAVTSILGASYLKDLFPDGINPDEFSIRVDPPRDVLPTVVDEMRAEKPDILLLLSYARPDESRELARAFPMFDLVVTAGGPEDPDGQPEPIGNSLLLRVGTKGKNCGVVGFYPDAADGKRFRFDVVELDRFRFGHAAAIDEFMKVYQEQLQAENLVENEPSIVHPRGPDVRFVGSEKCADCHAEAYAVWEGSEHHQHGFDSLTVAYAQASDDPSLKSRVRFDRIHDPECICCHTAGWDPQEVLRFESGFLSADKTPQLKGVHCENCHGPASRHIELEEAGAAEAELLVERAAMRIRKADAELKVCIKCHDHENSPDWNFETYWPQIEH